MDQHNQICEWHIHLKNRIALNAFWEIHWFKIGNVMYYGYKGTKTMKCYEK